MEINKVFDAIYESAERHDPVAFNRNMISVLKQIGNKNSKSIVDEIRELFIKEDICINCESTLPMLHDSMFIDNQQLFMSICPECGTEVQTGCIDNEKEDWR